MGQSKKKLRNKIKAERRVTPKAKRKAKKIQQIEDRNKLKDSKRKAAEAVSVKPGHSRLSGDLATEVSAVDKLFASLGEEEEEEDAEPLDDGSDESSAGAFHEVGVDDDDVGDLDEPLGPDDLEGLDEPDSAARHVEELKAIKEKDPEFYKFLVESDRALLDFRVPEHGEDEEAEDAEAGEQAPEAGEVPGAPATRDERRVLTPERLRRIHESVLDSFTACKAALNIYHNAVRSIEGKQEEAKADDEEQDPGDDKKGRKKKKREKKAPAKRKRRRARPGEFEIENEAIFSEVIEWSLDNLLGVFRHHAGKLRAARFVGKGGKKGKRGRKWQEDNAKPAEPDSSGVVDPQRYSRWSRVHVLAKIFWEETFYLLNHLVGNQMIEYVLRRISSPQALSWLWPFKKVRYVFVKKCAIIWSSATSQSVRLLAFLFLRNAGAMTMQLKESEKPGATPMLDGLIRMMIKGFAQAASMGYSWRSHNTFRFMENCFVEMLRLDDATAYRLGYVCIRQLAKILRDACIAVAHGDGKKKGQAKAKARGKSAKALSEKARKKRSAYQQAAQSLVAWPFVRAIYLWTKAVGSLPSLRELAYPLSMIIMGAVKSNLTKIQNFPFVYHCLLCQNRLGASLAAFVPVSSHLMKAYVVLLTAMEKAWKKRRGGPGKESTGLGATRAPEVEVLHHFSEGQVYDSLTLEVVGSSLCFLLVDHWGLLSRSPAFPELVSIVLMHVRKHRKHCRSEALRRQLTSFISAAETSSEDIRSRRENLTEAPPFTKFLVFDADSALAKMRETMLKRKADEERSRILAETKKDGKGEGKGDAANAKRDAKKKQREKKQAAAKEAAPAPKRQRPAAKEEGPTELAEDQVEEMAFSSGED
mmetsp:Transcript_44982/g.125140  ORF Transcript_44982/g.125140 Transcript_44982/m.125140 type:complete len:870 (-) Transcript_44982:223-2832(-)